MSKHRVVSGKPVGFLTKQPHRSACSSRPFYWPLHGFLYSVRLDVYHESRWCFPICVKLFFQQILHIKLGRLSPSFDPKKMTRHVLNKAPTACGSTFAKDPWDWTGIFTYMNGGFLWYMSLGAYSSLTGRNQLVINVYHEHFHLSKISGLFLSFPREKNGAGVLFGEFHHSVGGKNTANQLVLVVYPIIYKVLYIPRGTELLPSTVAKGAQKGLHLRRQEQ